MDIALEAYKVTVFGPRSDGESVPLDRYVLKSSVLHVSLEFRSRAWIPVEASTGIQQFGDPFLDVMFGLQGAILGIVLQIKILKLSITSRISIFVRLSDQLWPVLNGCGEISAMYKVEAIFEGPDLFSIVDFELDLRRNPKDVREDSIADTTRRKPCRLSRTEIGTKDLSVWKLICHLNRPDASPCSNVKNRYS